MPSETCYAYSDAQLLTKVTSSTLNYGHAELPTKATSLTPDIRYRKT